MLSEKARVEGGYSQSRMLAQAQYVCEWLSLTGSIWDLFEDKFSTICLDVWVFFSCFGCTIGSFGEDEGILLNELGLLLQGQLIERGV